MKGLRITMATALATISIGLASGCGGHSTTASSAAAATTAASTTAAAASPTVAAPTPPAPGRVPVRPPRGFPTGSYAMTVTHQQAADHTDLLGTWTLSLKANGTWSLVGKPGSITGTYTALRNSVSFLERTNTAFGGACMSVGTYMWKYTGPTLTFTEVADTCGDGGRAYHFTVNSWSKRP